jgi:hypothetical protein
MDIYDAYISAVSLKELEYFGWTLTNFTPKHSELSIF